ncbi:MAG: hypothetical protein DCC67_02465 [Planctomycetota bacterium]|nr:MAG: hypothetical protein DCC67_02465 [Planctomycetota bacterium]
MRNGLSGRLLRFECLEDRTVLDALPPWQVEPFVFASPSQPTGVTTDSFGNVSVFHVSTDSFSTVVSTLTSLGQPIAPSTRVLLDTPASLFTLRAPFAGYPAGEILALGQEGNLYLYQPGTAIATFIGSLRNFVYDASAIYDVQTGVTSSFGGVILPQQATYGDFAVHGDTLVAAGFYTFPFVLSLRITADGYEGKVLASSQTTGARPGIARGVAVNNQGRVLTTLPYSPSGDLNFGVDKPFAFDLDFHAGGQRPYQPIDVAFMSSWGMTTDTFGNYLVSTGVVGSSELPNAGGGLVRIASDFSQHEAYDFSPGGSSLFYGRDVAVNPDNTIAYVAVNAVTGTGSLTNVVLSLPYFPLRQDTGPPLSYSDIAPFHPAGWSDPLVISTVPGTHTDATRFTSADTLYLDWAVTNLGLTTPDDSFWGIYLIRGDLDGIRTVESVIGPIEPFEVLSGEDEEFGPYAPGKYTFSLYPNFWPPPYLSNLVEVNPLNNEFEKTIVITGPEQSVSGQVFNDVNGDGVRSLGELPVAGRRIFADLNGDGQWGAAASGTVQSGLIDYPFGYFETITSRFDVTGIRGQIVDLNVSFSISHNEVDDVILYLESPKGTRIRLFDDLANADYRDFNGTTLDDEAAISIFQGSPSYTGRYRPETPLSAFDGENAYGTWRLIVEDDGFNFHNGRLMDWSLTFTTVEPHAASGADGSYRLATAPGSFKVHQVAPEGWTITAPAAAKYDVSLAVNQRVEQRDFGTRYAPMLPGDYNVDNIVDGADFLAWQRTLGADVATDGDGADGDGSGTVAAGDLAVWRDSFGGTVFVAGQLASANATVLSTGPRPGLNGQAFFNIEGTALGAFASYGVLRFETAALGLLFDETFGAGGWQVWSIELGLTQSNASFSAAGPVSVWFTGEDATSLAPPTSPLAFPHDDGEFTDAQRIANLAFTPAASGTLDYYELFSRNSSPTAGAAALEQDLRNSGVVTLVLAPEAATVAATYAGTGHATWNGPLLFVTAVPRPGSLVSSVALAAPAVEHPVRMDRGRAAPNGDVAWLAVPRTADLAALEGASIGRRSPVAHELPSRFDGRDLALTMIRPPRRSAFDPLPEGVPSFKRREFEPAVRRDFLAGVDAAFEVATGEFWATDLDIREA